MGNLSFIKVLPGRGQIAVLGPQLDGLGKGKKREGFMNWRKFKALGGFPARGGQGVTFKQGKGLLRPAGGLKAGEIKTIAGLILRRELLF
jgi:hypothetical protein